MRVHGIRFSFVEIHPKCIVCGNLLYVPEVHDKNVETKKESYRKEKVRLQQESEKDAER